MKCGKGVAAHANGSVYEGLYRENMRNGQGKLRHADGTIYEGEWLNNLRHGMYYIMIVDL